MFISKRLGISCSLGALLLFTLAATSASASTIYTFNVDDCGGGCQVGNQAMGTVTVSDVTVNNNPEVQVAVQLASGFYFVNTGLGASFAFNIAGGPTITDYTTPSGFGWENVTGGNIHAGSIHMDGFGHFDDGLNCTTGCGSGGSNPTHNPSSLTFDISGNFNAASLATLSTGGSQDVYFAADVYSSATGNTGAIGASSSVVPTPEPTSLLLLGFGLVGISVYGKRHLGRATK
jgi:hypothetical protein